MCDAPSVTILVLNWNGAEDTIACVQSLENLQYDNYSVVIVDNGSEHDDLKKIKSELGHHQILENGENLGFAEGNNTGIRWARKHNDPDYILLLNNDLVVDPGFLTTLVCATEARNNVAVTGPAILHYDDRDMLWSAGIDEQDLFNPFQNVFAGEPKHTVPDTPFVTDAVIGAAFMMNVEYLDEIGLLDSNFFIIHEESDWCKRAREQGYECLVVSEAEVYHKVGETVTETDYNLVEYYNTRNKILYIRKHYSSLVGFFIIALLSVYKFRSTAHFFADGQYGKGKNTLYGIIDGVLGNDPRVIPE